VHRLASCDDPELASLNLSSSIFQIFFLEPWGSTMLCGFANLHRPLPTCLIAALALAGCDDRNTYQAPPPPEVKVAKPIQREVTLYAEMTGSTSAFNKVDLVARVSGFLEKVGFKDGDAVTKGQTLFVIERQPYQASLQAAQAVQDQQQALLVQADATLVRQNTLGKNDFTSRSSIEDAQAKRDSGAAAVEQAKAQVLQAQINLDYTEIKAPFDGVVSARLVDPGSVVGQGGPTKLATIVQAAPIHVTFNVNEQRVMLARQHLRGKGLTLKDLGPIPVEVGLQTETGFPHVGTIDYIAPMMDSGTGTLQARAVLDNTNTLLLPGLFVRVRVPTQRGVQAILVPDAALGTNQSGRYLLLVDDKDIVVQRRVETGDQTDDGLRIITSGLKRDDRVIVSGLQRAVPGNPVKPVQADATTAASVP
jgi:multidrug efflux system membrane fusion protein